MNNVVKWLEEAQNVLNKLSEFGQPGVCTFKQGTIDGCESADFDDSDWKQVMGKGVPIPGISTDSIVVEKEKCDLEVCDWSMFDGPAAMRKTLRLPETVEGISTKGSKIYLTLTMLAPLDIYVDGEKVASYKFWGDTRHCELAVTDAYIPGNTHVIVFKTPQNDGDAHLGVYINNSYIEHATLELSTAIEQINFAKKLSEHHQKPELDKALNDLDTLLCDDVIIARDWDAIRESIRQIDLVLKPFEKYAKEFKVHIIAHSHIDMNWLWDMPDTIDICERDFKTICDILDENPDLCFSQSQAGVYDIVQKHNPALFERVKEKIREGSWDITAGTWIEHDLNTSGGEVFARQALLASRFVKDELEAEPSKICWEPDTFGHPATTPNILAKSGIKYYYHFRCGQGYPIYWWEGTDGSRVLDFCYGPYNNALRPTNIMPASMELFNVYGMKTSMFVFGVGDHGGGPTRNDVRIKRYLDTKPVMPTLVFSSTHKFYEAALEEKSDYPVVRGEQNFIFEGCYTTKSKIKKLLRDGEARLLDAEASMSFAAMNQVDVSDGNEKVRRAWEHVCFNGFHDISCGCNIKAADSYDFDIGEEAVRTGVEVSREYLGSTLKAALDTEKADTIAVFNQLGFERDDIVEIESASENVSSLLDSWGQRIDVQYLDGKLSFLAKDVPALGCKTYRIAEEQTTPVNQDVAVRMADGLFDGSVCTMESDRYLLEISARTGTIVKLFDKVTGRDVLKRLKGEPEVAYAFKAERSSNLLQMFYEEPHIMSAWVIGNKFEMKNLIQTPTIEMVCTGPVKGTIRISRKYNQSQIDQYITIYNQFDRVDFSIDIDWQERGYYKESIPFLRVGFTTTLNRPVYSFETPMGWIDRKQQGVELPSLRFINLFENGNGVSLYNDSKFGFSVEGDSMYMSLLRGSYSPDAMPDQGWTKTKYAIRPYAGDKNMPSVVKGAAAFNQPLLACWSKGNDVNAETGQQGLTVSAENVVVSSVKPSMQNDGIIVRLVETAGLKTKAYVQLRMISTGVFETTIQEETIRRLPDLESMVEVDLKPFENITLLFKS